MIQNLLFLFVLLQAAPPETDEAPVAVEQALQSVSTSAASERASREAILLEAGRIGDLVATLVAEAPPRPDPVRELSDGPVEFLQAEVEHHVAYVDSLTSRGPSLEQLEGLATSIETRLQSWSDREAALIAAATIATDRLEALASSIANDEVAADAIVLPGDRTVEEWRDVLRAVTDGIDERQTQVATGTAQATRAREALGEIDPIPKESIDAAAREKDFAGLLLACAQLVRDGVKQLQDEDPAVVRAELERSMVAWRDGASVYTAMRRRFERRRAALESIDQEVSSVVAPRLEDFDGGDGHAELTDARRQLAYAEAMLAYRERRAALLQQSQSEAAALRDAAVDGQAAVRLIGSRLIDLRAAIAAARTLETKGTITELDVTEETEAEIWTALRALADQEVVRMRMVSGLGERLADEAILTSAVNAVQIQTGKVARARATLEEEEAYGAVLEETAQFDDDELIDGLTPGGALAVELEAASERVLAMFKEVEVARRAAQETRRALHLVDNPYAQHEINRLPDRGRELKVELDGLSSRSEANAMLPADASRDEPRLEDLEREVGQPPFTERTSGVSPSDEELRFLEREQRLARERLRYFHDLDQLVNRLKQQLDDLARAGEAYDLALTEIVQLERRRFAASRELGIRMGSAAIVPGADVGSITRAAVSDAETRRRNARAHVADIRAEFEDDLARYSVFLSWKKWAEIRAEEDDTSEDSEASIGARLGTRDLIQDLKVALIAQPVAHINAARTAIEDLREFERQDLTYKAREIRTDVTLLDRLLAAIADQGLRRSFEAPLEANSLEIVNLQRIRREYLAAAAAFKRLGAVTQQYRANLDGAMDALRAAEAVRLRDYQIARHHAAIAANPSNRIGVTTEFRHAYAFDLPEPLDDHGWDTFYWANQLLAAEARLWGDRRWIATLEHRLSRLGIETEINRYQGHISDIGAEVARNEEIEANLVERVDSLVADYKAALRSSGTTTLMKILMIPIVVFIVLRVVRYFTRRLQRSTVISDEDDDNADRQRRLRTLTNVAGASVTVVVWIIAVIYILASLGINVTPIIASASVAGLAVAFGAQALIRDFFAGFFILLENQYTVGDVVDVGSAAGTVEHITLRVTVLRDLEGVVHYVPNGMVQRVSNKTKEWSRIVHEVAVSHGENVDHVIGVLREILAGLQREEPWSRRIIEEPVVAGVQTVGENSIGIRLMIKVRAGRQWELARELRVRIKRRFDEEGIRAPYPQRVVHQLTGEDPSAAGKRK